MAIRRKRRELFQTERQHRLFEVVEEKRVEDEEIGIEFSEGLCISWIFYIIKSFYELLIFLMEASVLKLFSLGGVLAYGIKMNATQIQIGVLIAGVLFFPVSLWIYAKFWTGALFVGSHLFRPELSEEDRVIIAKEVVDNSLTSHMFLVIPFIGGLASFVASLIYLYAGLRENFKFHTLQSLVILLLPLFLFFLLVTLTVFLIVALILGF